MVSAFSIKIWGEKNTFRQCGFLIFPGVSESMCDSAMSDHIVYTHPQTLTSLWEIFIDILHYWAHYSNSATPARKNSLCVHSQFSQNSPFMHSLPSSERSTTSLQNGRDSHPGQTERHNLGLSIVHQVFLKTRVYVVLSSLCGCWGKTLQWRSFFPAWDRDRRRPSCPMWLLPQSVQQSQLFICFEMKPAMFV